MEYDGGTRVVLRLASGVYQGTGGGELFAGQVAAPGPSNNALVLLWGTTTWTALR